MPGHVTNVWLVGVGGMGREYGRVLSSMGQSFEMIGRGEASAAVAKEKLGVPVHTGGLAAFLERGSAPASHAIVATGIEDLAAACSALMKAGVRSILVEKPAGVDRAEVDRLALEAAQTNTRLIVAYNRRFYASTRRAKELIAEDGGVKSFTFEFTEWGHEIAGLPLSDRIKHNWLLANSSHVIDLAFFLGGEPRHLDARVSGAMSWHPSGAVFVGSGESSSGALFSYHANWAAPGRWGVEVLTAKRRLIFRPMEKLQITPLASVAITEEPIDNARDLEFKPGLYDQTVAFLAGDSRALCTIAEHAAACRHYDTIGRGHHAR
ncbi:MAG TPA: Gfo/Idh/MocA family oxidoreductase [Kofleriaceae bacterium]